MQLLSIVILLCLLSLVLPPADGKSSKKKNALKSHRKGHVVTRHGIKFRNHHPVHMPKQRPSKAKHHMSSHHWKKLRKIVKTRRGVRYSNHRLIYSKHKRKVHYHKGDAMRMEGKSRRKKRLKKHRKHKKHVKRRRRKLKRRKTARKKKSKSNKKKKKEHRQHKKHVKRKRRKLQRKRTARLTNNNRNQIKKKPSSSKSALKSSKHKSSKKKKNAVTKVKNSSEELMKFWGKEKPQRTSRAHKHRLQRLKKEKKANRRRRKFDERRIKYSKKQLQRMKLHKHLEKKHKKELKLEAKEARKEKEKMKKKEKKKKENRTEKPDIKAGKHVGKNVFSFLAAVGKSRDPVLSEESNSAMELLYTLGRQYQKVIDVLATAPKLLVFNLHKQLLSALHVLGGNFEGRDAFQTLTNWLKVSSKETPGHMHPIYESFQKFYEAGFQKILELVHLA